MWNIDERSLELTARVLETMNPGRASAAHIRDMIRANMEPDVAGSYIATGGWVAYSWAKQSDGGVVISVAVAPYTAAKYADVSTDDLPLGAG